MSKISLTKMHGAGNDYIYVNAMECPIANPEKAAVVWSDRHKGIGGDGLIMIDRSEVADFKMRMFNNDGSEGIMCGNGIRCVGKYVYDHQMTHQQDVSIETLSGVKTVHLHLSADGLVDSATVDMGQPQLEMPAQCTKSTAEGAPISIDLNGHHYEGTFVSMGNPHFVIPVKDIQEVDLTQEGSALERHPLFPEGCNIEFVQPLTPYQLRTRVWERGSGITQACGTGACATVVAATLRGITDHQADIQMDGGTLHVEWSQADHHIYLTGPAETVFDGQISIP